MSKIALREYHRNIERLIEEHSIADALSHCENILQSFPKDIETYRKAGKVFLEKQDYANAEKVFNIILSVFPDDFVANIGLSFIHEQNNRMDQAIQHMQNAFELQPANETLQDELKRLYNKRDHVEPPRIRLTRGALIKMYKRSDLYEQAIAETRLGLHEKPGRIDYKLALADMLWKSDKHIEAVETCVDILSRLPYCWLANEIMDKAFYELNPSDPTKEKNHYRARLAELDPYYQYMLPSTRAVADIPDIAVQIDNTLAEADEYEALDWATFLDRTWSAIPNTEAEAPIEHNTDLNWTSIIDESMDESAVPSVDEEAALSGSHVINQLGETEVNDPSAGRRQAFLDKLQKRSAGQTAPESIPDWVLEEESPLDQPETTGGFIPIPSDLPLLDDIDLPEITEESGLIDHDIPVEIPEELTETPASTQWVPDQQATGESQMDNSQETPKPVLQDTQQIRVVREETPEEKLDQARKALEGENIQYALKKIQEIVGEERFLEPIKDALELACQDNPDNAQLWLTLGNIYQRLGLKEKALEVFIRAQKQISF
ncbi:MAG: hypothetical protein PWQ55_385 [Chloroflexota bacterium]|nr:hypothetical protein [Chloroflexota bacterium]